MVSLHKQRFSVLLLITSVFYSFLWLNTHLSNFCDINITYNLLQSSCNNLELSLLLDSISMSFGCVVTFIAGCVFMFSRWYMKDDPYYFRFTWILLFFVISMNVLIFSGSLVMMLVGWDGLGVTSFALIIYYQSKDSLHAGFLTLLINRLGDVIIMSMIIWFMMSGGSMLTNYYSTNNTHFVLLCLLCVAAMTKSAQYPFSAWLPAAMAAPTPVSALVHSSTLVTAGIYIIIRANYSMNIPTEMLSVFLFTGSITTFMGGLCAVYENDLKKIIALSTLSQLGVMVFSLGLSMPLLSLLHLYTHAMFKALLFLVAGCVLMVSYGVQDIRLLGAVMKTNPFLLCMMNMSAFCLMGLPFLSAFYSKHAIVNSMLSMPVNFLSLLLMVVAVSLSSLYMVRLLKCLNWSNKMLPLSNNDNRVDVKFYMPLILLYIGSLMLGWLMSILTKDSLVGTFIPSRLESLMWCLMLLSVLIAIYMMKYKGSLLLTSMFFTDPFYKEINMLSYKVSCKVKQLDIGWIEPATYVNCYWNKLNALNRYLWWPYNNMSLSQHLLLLSFLGVALWYF